MKIKFFFLSLAWLGLANCSKKSATFPHDSGITEKVTYDTTAIDSFSTGAVSVDVARKIRMSSAAYKDSVKKVMLIMEEERKKKEEQLKLEKTAKAELEKEKAKQVADHGVAPENSASKP